MKKYKVLIPLLSVIAAASIVLAVLSPKYFQKTDGQAFENFSLAGSKYTPMLAFSGTLDFPPLQTDIDSIFYTVNPSDGTAAFYEYSSAGLAPYSGEITELETTVTCSNQGIPVKLYYVKQGNLITGYGLFTTALRQAPVKIFDYAFFKLTNLPACYGKSGALLLIDFEKTAFYLNDKLYTEAFTIDLKSGKTDSLTKDNGRTVDRTGALRPDWIMLNDGFLKSLGSTAFFLSSRDYTLDQQGLVSDILTIGEPKPPRTVKGILGLWARVTENGLAYLRATENGFDSVVFADKQEVVVKSFDGDYFNDYLSSGNYVLNKNSLVLTDLLTGTEKTLSGLQAGSAAFFSISPDGSRAVIASPGMGEPPARDVQTLVLYNLKTDTAVTVVEPLLFSPTNSNFRWIDNETLFHLRPTEDDGTGLGYCFIKI